MPLLKSMLAGYDLDLLNRIARFWKKEISQRDRSAAMADLLSVMTFPGELEKILNNLSPEVLKAWEVLVSNAGQIPYAAFSRQFGAIREYGPARRERENPDRNPISTTEYLWYSGLVGRAFLAVTGEPQEYVYVPDEFRKVYGFQRPVDIASKVRPAVSQQPKKVLRANSAILDHLIDILAAARMSRTLKPDVFTEWGIPREFLNRLLFEMGMVDAASIPQPELLKTFFEVERERNLADLFQYWKDSSGINELRMLPGLVFEGTWENDPQSARGFLINILKELKPGTWWSFSSLVSMIKEGNPDFQRPAGDYDSWFIRRQGSEEYLGGFEYWDEIEAALIIFLVTGPLFWFGMVDLVQGVKEGERTAFRITEIGSILLKGNPLASSIEEKSEIGFQGSDTLLFPHIMKRALRYQVGRFCELSRVTSSGVVFQITPESLEQASSQGLTVNQLVLLLAKNNRNPLPVSLVRLADRWQQHGLEVVVSEACLIKFQDESTCQSIFTDPKAARFTLGSLNPTTLLARRSQVEAIQKFLADSGILSRFEQDV